MIFPSEFLNHEGFKIGFTEVVAGLVEVELHGDVILAVRLIVKFICGTIH